MYLNIAKKLALYFKISSEIQKIEMGVLIYVRIYLLENIKRKGEVLSSPFLDYEDQRVFYLL
jgi:hypothetical protein